jgi:aspartyl-tRNA(Asn)/glutamyl-tRNA(Gln) amidotransferase subunit A
MIDVTNLTISKARVSLKNKEYSVKDLVGSYVKNIEEKNGEIHAYLEIFSDWEAQAEVAQKKIDAGEDLPLLGIPVAMKDNILIEERTASASSKMLENYTASYDSTVTKKLKEAGAIFIGRTNMDEFAMGGSTENSAFGVTKNPHDIERVPGGSSGGSAAAVAMSGCLAALGTDTGGSIRQPASFCGLVGFKPTYGAVSRSGLIAMGSSLDQAGPLTNSVSDSEIIHNVIKGEDPLDSTSISDDFYTKDEYKSDKPVIGIPESFVKMDGIDEKVLKVFEASVEILKKKGYEVKNIDLAGIELSLAVYYVLMPAEVSSNLGRYDGLRYGLPGDGKDLIDDYFKSRAAGFGDEVRRRIVLGTYVLSEGYSDEYYYKAKASREQLRTLFTKAYTEVDVILTPTAPTPAFKIGEKSEDPVAMYLSDIFTVTANITGVPAISLPANREEVEKGELPIGIQLMAAHGREDTLFEIGKDFLNE